MRSWMIVLPFTFVAALMGQMRPPAYPPAGAPAFGGDNPEGLVVSRNPAIRHAWLRPVHWKPGPLEGGAQGGTPPVTASERAQVLKALDAVSAALRATPEGSQGRGFWVSESRRVLPYSRYEIPANAAAARWPLAFEVGFFPFYHEDVQEANGKWRLSVNGETESVYFEFNRLPGRVEQPVVATEKRGADLKPVEFYLRPRETQRVAGMPVYEGQVLVAAAAGRDVWAPVALGRVLKAVAPMLEADRKTAEQRLEGYRKTNAERQSAEWERAEWARFEKDSGALKTSRPTVYETRKTNRERYIQVTRADAAAAANPQRGDAKGAWYWNPVDAVEELNKRIAALTPEQAAQPACYSELKDRQALEGRYQVKGSFSTLAGAPADCRPVVMDNAEYFDLKLGRAAVQIMTVPMFGRCAVFANGQMAARSWGATFKSTPPQGCYRHVLMWRDLEWAKISGQVSR